MSAKYYPIKCTPTVEHALNFDANADAEAVHKALHDYPIDKDTIIKIVTRRSSGQRLDIIIAYKASFGKDFLKDVKKSKLSGKFKDVIIALMTPLKDLYAIELNDAIRGLGTNEDAIIEILITLSNYGIQKVATRYEKLFKHSLEEDLKGDTSGQFKRFCVSLSQGSRNETRIVDSEAAVIDAQALHKAGEGKWGTDESVFNSILVSRSYLHLDKVFSEYEKLVGHDIKETIKKEFFGDLRVGLLNLVKCIKSRTDFFAERLYKSMKGLGTDDKTLIRIVVGRSEIDLGNIKESFQRKYQEKLEEWIEDNTSGSYRKTLLSVISRCESAA